MTHGGGHSVERLDAQSASILMSCCWLSAVNLHRGQLLVHHELQDHRCTLVRSMTRAYTSLYYGHSVVIVILSLRAKSAAHARSKRSQRQRCDG